MKSLVPAIFTLLLASGAPAQTPAAAPDSGNAFARQVTEFRLSNGLRFVVLERHEAPVISFRTYVRAGSANIPAGQSGLGRLLERLAWSGTETIGTTDWASEKKALDAVEAAYDRLEAEQSKGQNGDAVKVTSLRIDAQTAMDRARQLTKPDAYRQALTDQGATGLLATVMADSVQYACTLPSNRAELWFSMESQRLVRPVLRGFYKERDDLAEQRYANPEARLMEGFLATAFLAHPYRNPPNGWKGDLENLRTADFRAFLDRYFVPGNMTIAAVGDITAAEARRLAERYFAGPAWSAKPVPADIPTEEPAQTAPRVSMEYRATAPLVAIGYRRPNQYDREDPVFDVIESILSGDQGWLAEELTQKKSLAGGVRPQPAFPGGRYPPLFAILLAPAPGRGLDQTVAAVEVVLDRLRNQPLDQVTLDSAKGHVREVLLTALGQNESAAALLAASAAEFGDWREPFRELDAVNRVTGADVQRVAAKYFVPEHRTVAFSGAGAAN